MLFLLKSSVQMVLIILRRITYSLYCRWLSTARRGRWEYQFHQFKWRRFRRGPDETTAEKKAAEKSDILYPRTNWSTWERWVMFSMHKRKNKAGADPTFGPDWLCQKERKMLIKISKHRPSWSIPQKCWGEVIAKLKLECHSRSCSVARHVGWVICESPSYSLSHPFLRLQFMLQGRVWGHWGCKSYSSIIQLSRPWCVADFLML